MKLIEYFNDFLKSEVNLNQTRLDIANNKIETITSFIKNNEEFGEKIINFAVQGSFKHKTIIKPVNEDDEFDVDLLIELKKVDNWEAKDYINKLYYIFNNSNRYKEIVSKNTRCITLNYSGDFHMDLVPCIKSGDNYYIFNKKTNKKEITDGYGYAVWFKEKNKLTNGSLKKVVRLLKFLRDYKNIFNIKSILLTTLIAREVNEEDEYIDVPTTLKLLVNNLSSEIEKIKQLENLDLSNPILEDEQFNRHIDKSIYKKFRKNILLLNTSINEAFECEDKEDSIKLWKEIFGDSFGNKKSINFISKMVENEWQGEKPKWREKLEGKVIIKGEIFNKISEYNTQKYNIQNGHKFNKKGKIKFTAYLYNIYGDYEVKWQVVNSGEEVRGDKEKMRGDFFDGRDENLTKNDNPLINWEGISYKGIHWIQCFIIKKEYIVGKSERFYVILE